MMFVDFDNDSVYVLCVAIVERGLFGHNCSSVLMTKMTIYE